MFVGDKEYWPFKFKFSYAWIRVEPIGNCKWIKWLEKMGNDTLKSQNITVIKYDLLYDL